MNSIVPSWGEHLPLGPPSSPFHLPPLDKSSKEKACITENLKRRLGRIAFQLHTFLFFKIWVVSPFNTSLLQSPWFCPVLVFICLYSVSSCRWQHCKGRQFIFYFTIPQSTVYSVLNKKHSINVCLTGKQEGKLRFREGDCNITQNHIKESE